MTAVPSVPPLAMETKRMAGSPAWRGSVGVARPCPGARCGDGRSGGSYGGGEGVRDLVAALRAVVGDPRQVSASPSALEQHGRDLTYHPPRQPQVVVYPEDTAEVQEILRLAQQWRVPVVPYGAGSSLEGHVIPVQGGISLDLSRMDRVVALDPVARRVRVQAGLTRSRLNAYLAREGLFFPVDPGADATLGGMAATNASGTNALRYGAMKHQVLGLEVVLAGGGVVRTGELARWAGSPGPAGAQAGIAAGATGGAKAGSKAGGTAGSTAGMMAGLPDLDLTALFVGSEGTLGVITELVVKVYPLPEAVLAARVTFPDLEAAARAAVDIARGCPTATRIELLDERTLTAVNAFRGTAYPERPALFLEWAGAPPAVEADAARGRDLCAAQGGTGFEVERDEAGRARLWDARHHAGLAVTAVAPGRKKMSTDVCVPLSALPAAIRHARATIDAYGFPAGIVAHAGDGNFHVLFAVDPANPEEIERAKRANAAIVRHALACGGTCTGEHGVGLGKRRFLLEEHGPAVDVMRAIKDALDPHGILNPGKVLPTPA